MSIAMVVSKKIENIMKDKYAEIENKVQELKDKKEKLANIYKHMDKSDARENGDLDEALKAMASNAAALYAALDSLNNFKRIENLSRYNSTGMVVIYSTVYLRWKDKTKEWEEGIFRIYPGDISFPELGVVGNSDFTAAENHKKAEDGIDPNREVMFGAISENSPVAVNLRLKSMEDIPTEGLRINGVQYKVMEVY